ncbi:hypothetical protein MMC19_000615 [Ptychographa xylographoides]|nr:hypothetical protein [Ptychographa xylographoides]
MRASFLIPAFLAALPTVVLGVGIDAFGETACNGFEEFYNLNPNSKGNLAGPRESFSVVNPQSGCHMKFYTGLNQQPNDASTLSFSTANAECYWISNGQQFLSFGFYCP